VLRDVETPIQKRAGALLERLIACGSLHVRSHVDVDPEIGLSHVEAMLALRETYRQFVDLQLVAFPQQGMLIRPGTAELMERAIEMGVEVVGGIDPAGIDGDPMAQLRTIFDIAARHGRGIDIHLHDQGELGAWEVERIADFTAASGLKGKVMVSHAYCLGSVPEGRAGAIGERLAELGISLMTTAPADTPSPPVARLRALGVNVCCGSDGIRDAWSPFGTGDMLQRAMLLCQRFDWVREDEIAAAFDCASAAGAKALGIERYGLALGNEANFVMVGAECLTDAIASQPPNRTVVRQGRVVAAGKPLSGGT
jgi:cytosine deaminase